MLRWSWLPWLLIACSKPLASSTAPGVAKLEEREAVAARRYAGCWAVRNPGPDAAGEMDELVVLELDTVAIVEAGARSPLLRAVGRSGVRRPERGRAPEYGWTVFSGTPDTIDVAQGGLSYTGWRLIATGDTLVGRKYQLWDMGGVETDAGPASARRVACR